VNAILLHEYEKPLNDISDITIKFKTDPDPTNDLLYNEFNGHPHSIKLRLGIIKCL